MPVNTTYTLTCLSSGFRWRRIEGGVNVLQTFPINKQSAYQCLLDILEYTHTEITFYPTFKKAVHQREIIDREDEYTLAILIVRNLHVRRHGSHGSFFTRSSDD